MNFFSKIKENLFPIFQITLIVLLIFLVGVFVVVMCFEDPKRIFKLLGVSGSENPKYEVLKFLGIGMGGVLVALQALMSYKRAKAMEDTAKAQADAANAQADAAQAQARATEEQARANENTEQGLRQERLKNAIEHLGHERDSVRLGGAYELFHLAEDNKDLRKTAFDMLCLHIRQTTGESEYQKAHASKPSEEVQSLLTLLFVQDHEIFKGLQINLQGSWLNGADLVTARLEKAVLTRVHLQGADLSQAYLQGADLFQAHLQLADLPHARLQGASLYEAYLQGAFLFYTHLQGASLFLAHLEGAVLEGARLQGAILFQAHLEGAKLERAKLQGASLTLVGLQGASLTEAHLQGARSEAWAPTFSFSGRIQMQIGQETDLLMPINPETLPVLMQMGQEILSVLRLRDPETGLLMQIDPEILPVLMQMGQEILRVGAIFEGGLSQEYVDDLIAELLIAGLPKERANELQENLGPHIDIPESNELPEDSGAITGAYTAEEAEEWITEYEEAMSELPEGDN